MTIGKRLKSLREDKEITQRELARRTKINPATICLYENDDKIPTTENLQALATFYHVTTDYLLGMNKSDNLNLYEIPEMVSINVVGRVPAGVPVEAMENIIDTIEIPKSWTKGNKQYIGLLVSGDSMYPKYQVGDIIIIQVQEDCENGQDAVVYVNGYDATLKTVRKVGNAIMLQPINQKYETKTYGPNDEPVKIFGIVKRLVRDI